MRIASTAVSFTVHAGLALAAVWATARDAEPASQRIVMVEPITAPGTSRRVESTTPVAPNVPDGDFQLPPDISTAPPDGIAAPGPLFPARPLVAWIDGTTGAPGSAGGEPIDVRLADDPPLLLAGPVPAYPDLLRQAGLEGRVVLEAVVDTTGRVEPGSIAVVAATNPAFVAAAWRALAASLFRPGRMHGHAVRVRIRLPTSFVLDRNR
ncbi:MAG TPA: TonB family protein [Gemmatimonadales bacterium]